MYKKIITFSNAVFTECCTLHPSVQHMLTKCQKWQKLTAQFVSLPDTHTTTVLSEAPSQVKSSQVTFNSM